MTATCPEREPEVRSRRNGVRVKKVDGSGTTYYVGGLYEKMEAGGVVTTTSYYYAAGQRVAMRTTVGVSTTVTYLHSDHLGSTSLTTDAAGALLARVLYYPYGETRYTEGTLQTDYGYTGQRNEGPGLGGLMDYGARHYDPYLGRFVSADTIVPGTEQPQSWNRYAYVRNNPLLYVDPSGHTECKVGEKSTECYKKCVAGGGGTDCRHLYPPEDPVLPPPPPIPDSAEEGDLATPFEVGVEWLTGQGDRHHEFREGDPFTRTFRSFSDRPLELWGKSRFCA